MKKTTDDLRHFLTSCGHSAAGIVAVFKNEIAFRQEVAMAVPHFALLHWLDWPVSASILLTALLGGVLSLELMNSAVECVVDLVSPDYQELAKRAKDAASAAVGVMLALYVGAWGVVIALKLCK